MTDEELKTALNCCMEWTANGGNTDCANCPMDKGKPCHVNLHLAALKRIEELETENAALREKLEKAVELPCKVGDTVYQYDNAGRIYVSKIKNIVYETNGIAFDKRAINNSIFLTRAEAESRLAELKAKK